MSDRHARKGASLGLSWDTLLCEMGLERVSYRPMIWHQKSDILLEL